MSRYFLVCFTAFLTPSGLVQICTRLSIYRTETGSRKKKYCLRTSTRSACLAREHHTSVVCLLFINHIVMYCDISSYSTEYARLDLLLALNKLLLSLLVLLWGLLAMIIIEGLWSQIWTRYKSSANTVTVRQFTFGSSKSKFTCLCYVLSIHDHLFTSREQL